MTYLRQTRVNKIKGIVGWMRSNNKFIYYFTYPYFRADDIDRAIQEIGGSNLSRKGNSIEIQNKN